MASVKRNYPVTGLGCAACVNRVQNSLREVPGVSEASVSLASNSAQVVFDPSVVQPSGLREAVRAAGYDLVVPDEDEPDGEEDPATPDEELELKAEKLRAKEYRRLRRDMWTAIVLAVAIMLLSFGFKDFQGKGLLLFALAFTAVFWCGRRFIRGALSELRHWSAGMDTLVALSTVISLIFSTFNLVFPGLWTRNGLEAPLYFDSCAMIVAFILVGRVLEEQAKRGTTAAIRSLSELQPRRIRAKAGDVIRIKPGQRIPADGVVVDGDSYIDESMLTGEPIAVYKPVGARVWTGTMNGNGALKVRVEKTGQDTMLSGIIRMVRDAQGSRARIQNIVDKVAAVFVPVVVLLAFAVFVFWTVTPAGGFVKALLCMVSVLVIACPCSLGLATPTAIIAGIGRCAQKGILVKDADALQAAKDIDTVVLDKTGTLTRGVPRVCDEYWVDPGMKGVLKAMEMHSEHPLAAAVLEHLREVEPMSVSSFRNIPGEGIEASRDNLVYFAGNHGSESSVLADKWAEAGMTVVWFSDEDRLIAVLAIEDQLKEESQSAVASLKESGIQPVMLTGDNEASALLTAGKLGITEVRAGVLPAEKALYVKQLQEQGKKVAMVGDGINDSAALAGADVSIAMGAGSDIAMEAAMVTIVSSELGKISELAQLSKKTVRVIRENLFWAFIYNVIAIPAAAGLLGFSLTPSIAALCMALSSVCVVCNSLRLRKA